MIHEFGHFIVAKWTGVKVNEFAIGMGPRLLKWGRGETVYSIRMLPIGGFCAMQGEDEGAPTPSALGGNDKSTIEEIDESLRELELKRDGYNLAMDALKKAGEKDETMAEKLQLCEKINLFSWFFHKKPIFLLKYRIFEHLFYYSI